MLADVDMEGDREGGSGTNVMSGNYL